MQSVHRLSQYYARSMITPVIYVPAIRHHEQKKNFFFKFASFSPVMHVYIQLSYFYYSKAAYN